ncbi:MAG: protein-L-isoaspartate O-methyltransferase, partial [Nitrospirota bacterium]|nr:protein-L-isoaspartate O-methyltransferase [Nitrospirota bacterium]
MSYEYRRHLMVQDQLRGRGIRDERVLSAMEAVPRHMFVSERLHDNAYDDCALPIGEGQTISQPYMVALMTEL